MSRYWSAPGRPLTQPWRTRAGNEAYAFGHYTEEGREDMRDCVVNPVGSILSEQRLHRSDGGVGLWRAFRRQQSLRMFEELGYGCAVVEASLDPIALVY
jgi:hypothetical protein